MATSTGESALLHKIREHIVEAHSLFQQLVSGYKEDIAAVIQGGLPDCKAKTVEEVLKKVFTRCRNEIVACRLPADFGARAKQIAAELCRALSHEGERCLRAVRPELLPPLELRFGPDSSPSPDPGPGPQGSREAELKLLSRFKERVRSIKERYWAVIQAPHKQQDGTTADKRTLLVRYACRRGLPQYDAEDVAQEALTKALAHLYQYEPRPGKSFMNWLYIIAQHALIDFCRRKEKGGKMLPEAKGEEEGEGGIEGVPAEEKSVARKALEEVLAVRVVSRLIEVCSGSGDPEGPAKALICAFHQILGYKPREIIAELGGFPLRELLEEFRAACLRLEAFDRNEALVDELFQPFRERIQQPDGPGRLIGDLQLAEFWQEQKRADYYIQNVSRRTWKRVATYVKANLPGEPMP